MNGMYVQMIEALHKKRMLKQQEAERKAEAWRQHIIAMQQQQQQERNQQANGDPTSPAADANESSSDPLKQQEDLLRVVYPGLVDAGVVGGDADHEKGKKRRRSSSAKVDYVALNKEL